MPYVIKATGERVPFDENKVLSSIKRAGIPEDLQSEVIETVKSRIYEDIPTSEIYKIILTYLSASNQPFSKGRYSLKSAIMELGPTGYPFEDYFAKILETQGYKTQVRQIVSGKCVSHEIDVVSEKDGKKSMIEAKFHNMPGIRTDIHVGLYTKARFDDVKEKNQFDRAWLVTNTKATTEVVSYCQCVGLKLIDWAYPPEESLRDMVEKANLFPITAIQSLSSKNIQDLLQNHVVLCKELNLNSFERFLPGISSDLRTKILKEAAFLSKT